VHVVDLDDLPHVTLYRRIKRMSGVKKRLGYTLEFFKTFFYELRALTGFNVVLATNERDAQRLRRWNRNLLVRVIPNGVDIEAFNFTNNDFNQDKIILFLGALDYEPNERAVEWLCTSLFPQIRRQVPQAKVSLVGRNPSRLVQSLVAPGIALAENVPDVRPYLRDCSVAVVPIAMGGGTRIKILEAAAAGRPVVSTSLGAEGLNFTPGAEIEIADTEDELVRKTADLLSNRAKAEQMAKLARLRVEREYSWELSKSKLADAISPWR
jgi:glycosyltransferase involved in cell wall biosynthesis